MSGLLDDLLRLFEQHQNKSRNEILEPGNNQAFQANSWDRLPKQSVAPSPWWPKFTDTPLYGRGNTSELDRRSQRANNPSAHGMLERNDAWQGNVNRMNGFFNDKNINAPGQREQIIQMIMDALNKGSHMTQPPPTIGM